MSSLEMPTRFMAKKWIFIAQSIIFGILATFSLVLGPLFLFGFMNDANGRPATDAGIGLTVMGVPMMLIFALAVYNIRARRHPLLRLFREGIEFVQIGRSSLDGFPLIPGMIRVAWLILSLQGFRRRIVRVLWQDFEDAWVSGPPMASNLTILAPPSLRADDPLLLGSPVADRIVLPEAMFSTPLDHIATSIKWHADHALDLRHLASWDDAEADDAQLH